jgi:hypothetical protein
MWFGLPLLKAVLQLQGQGDFSFRSSAICLPVFPMYRDVKGSAEAAGETDEGLGRRSAS